MIPSDANILNSGLRQSAVRQIAFSLHEPRARAEAGAVSNIIIGRKWKENVISAG
jgi:hypothetical protein